MIYVPFLGSSVMGVTSEEIAAHITLKGKVNNGDFSSVASVMVKAGIAFEDEGMTEIGEKIVPWVAPLLVGAIGDCILPYAVALWFTLKVMKSLLHAILTVNGA